MGIKKFLKTFADVATLGGYSATKNAIDDTTDLISDMIDGDDSGNSSKLGANLGEFLSGGALKTSGSAQGGCGGAGDCCPRFTMVGDFILNTNTGKVWKYEPNSNAFIGIQKKPTRARLNNIQRDASDLKGMINQGIEQKIKGLSQTERAEAKKEFQLQLLKPIDDYVKAMR